MEKQHIIIKKLVWEEKNIAHIALHKIALAEVEEVCQNDPIERTGHKNRVFLVGETAAGRMLAIILNPSEETGVYYPVTAYDASRQSTQDYRDEKGGEKAA